MSLYIVKRMAIGLVAALACSSLMLPAVIAQAPTFTLVRGWGGAIAEFRSPQAVAVDGEGDIYIVDLFHRVQKLSPKGVFLGKLENIGPVSAIGLDSAGNLYVVDTPNNNIRQFKQQ